MKRIIFLGFGLAMVLGLSGCATIATTSDYVKTENFSNLKTYSWVSDVQKKTGDARVDSALTDSRIRNAIDNELLAKGFQKQASGATDFKVSYQAMIETKTVETIIDPPYMAPSAADIRSGDFHNDWAFAGKTAFVDEYDEGTVLVDIVNPKTNQLIWRGTGKATVLENASPEKREARINEGIKKILSQFPPR